MGHVVERRVLNIFGNLYGLREYAYRYSSVLSFISLAFLLDITQCFFPPGKGRSS